RQDGNRVVVDGPLHAQLRDEVQPLESFDDWKKFGMARASAPTLLFLSQQYHPSWKARGPWGPLETVIVNDFFQGVIVPPGVSEVGLQFRPWVRWAWVPQLAYVISALGCAVLALNRWRLARRTPAAAQPSLDETHL